MSKLLITFTFLLLLLPLGQPALAAWSMPMVVQTQELNDHCASQKAQSPTKTISAMKPMTEMDHCQDPQQPPCQDCFAIGCASLGLMQPAISIYFLFDKAVIASRINDFAPNWRAAPLFRPPILA